MNAEYYLLAVVVALVALYFLLPRLAGNYLKFRGTRVITCPETREPAAVEVDATHAALSSVTGPAGLRLKDCTRWPERHDCGQECLLQIEMAPADCLARNMLARWYEGKSCAYCRKSFGQIQWSEHKPGLMSPEGELLEWSGVPPETLPRVLEDHIPVCWDCLVAESFRKEHPALVTDNPWQSTSGVSEKRVKVG